MQARGWKTLPGSWDCLHPTGWKNWLTPVGTNNMQNCIWTSPWSSKYIWANMWQIKDLYKKWHMDEWWSSKHVVVFPGSNQKLGNLRAPRPDGKTRVKRSPDAISEEARQSTATLSATATHTHQQGISSRSFDHPCHAREVLQHVQET